MNRRQADPPWLTKLRALLGSGTLAWELAADHLHHWPLLVLVFWLLGGPVEVFVRFLTSGRLEINVKRDPEDEDT